VAVQVEEGAESLAEGDGAAHRLLDSESAGSASLPGEDLSQVEVQDVTEESVVAGQQKPDAAGKADDPLAVRGGRQDVVDQMGGGVGHAPGGARRADAAALAGEGHELLVGAAGAADADEAAPQQAAFEEALELALDEAGIAGAVLGALAGVGEKLLEVVRDDLVEGGLGGFAARW